MAEDNAKVQTLLRQQAALASFGTFALRETELLKVLNEAARVCAQGLDVPYCKVCRYRPEENDLLIVAGYGWGEGIINNVVSKADKTSPQGNAFISRNPSICSDLREDNDFILPAFYKTYNIVSTIDVVINGSHENKDGIPFGVLEIDNDRQHDYDQNDINFLTGFANIMAEAVATSIRMEILQLHVREKDHLLEQKAILGEELQHRVRNNLQLVYGMLSKQLEDTNGQEGRQGLKAIARRVSTIAQVYDHLLGSEMTSTTDFGSYLKDLCGYIAEMQSLNKSGINLTCNSEPLFLDLNKVTSLGLIVAELVTNCCDHAFPNGKGTVFVDVHRMSDDPKIAVVAIRDDGVGFRAEPGSTRHGLSLVRRLVEQIRGTVSVESNKEPGMGTLWTVTFPLTRLDGSAAGTVPSAAA